MTKQETFFSKYADYAMQGQLVTGVPASITLAQAALESNWGQSGLTVQANNFFGVKDSVNDDWNGEYVIKSTKEFKNGQYITIQSKFRKYKTPKDSFIDHAKFLMKYDRYNNLFELSQYDYENWAKLLEKDGYATDPLYAEKLIGMIKLYKLNEYDVKAVQKKNITIALFMLVFAGVFLGIGFYLKKTKTIQNKILFSLSGALFGLLVTVSYYQIKKSNFKKSI